MTKKWRNNCCHHGSMFLMSPLCSGSTSGLIDLFVSAISRIPLKMSDMPFVALSHPFCVENILWRARTGQLNSVWRNGKSWGILLVLCYECVSQYLKLVSVLCLTVAFVCQRGSQTFWILVSTLLRSSRSANNGPRVYRYMPLTNTPLTKMLLMWIYWRP